MKWDPISSRSWSEAVWLLVGTLSRINETAGWTGAVSGGVEGVSELSCRSGLFPTSVGNSSLLGMKERAVALKDSNHAVVVTEALLTKTKKLRKRCTEFQYLVERCNFVVAILKTSQNEFENLTNFSSDFCNYMTKSLSSRKWNPFKSVRI